MSCSKCGPAARDGAGTQQLDTAVAPRATATREEGLLLGTERGQEEARSSKCLTLQPGTPPQHPALEKFAEGLVGPSLAVQKSQVLLSIAVPGLWFRRSLQTAKSANAQVPCMKWCSVHLQALTSSRAL